MGDNGTNDYVVFRTTRAGRSDDEIKARRAFPGAASVRAHPDALGNSVGTATVCLFRVSSGLLT